MKIAFDIDGVLADFSAGSIRVIRDLNLVPGLPDDYEHHAWDFNDILAPGQWRREVFGHMLTQENMWLNLPAHEENCAALKEYIVRNGERDICFVTSRPPCPGASVVLQTQLWLNEHDIGTIGMNVFVTENSDHKRQVLEGERIQFYIDDLGGNVRATAGIVDHRAFLLDRPYNRHDIDLPRVYSVAEFLLEVEAAS